MSGVSQATSAKSANNNNHERTLDDGSVEVSYSNGNRKLVSSDGRTVKVFMTS